MSSSIYFISCPCLISLLSSNRIQIVYHRDPFLYYTGRQVTVSNVCCIVIYIYLIWIRSQLVAHMLTDGHQDFNCISPDKNVKMTCQKRNEAVRWHTKVRIQMAPLHTLPGVTNTFMHISIHTLAKSSQNQKIHC